MNLEHFREKLLDEKERLEKDINYYQKEDSDLGTDMSPEITDDYVTEFEGHERLQATSSELNQALSKVNAALSRIEKGTYGICENCGQKIDQERLEVNPSASLCLSCQQKKKRG